jgi:hypothetical protein
MSKSWFYLSIISSLAIFISSCGNDGDNKAATPTPTPSVSTSPTTAPAAPSTTATTPATTKPVLPGTTPPGTPVAAIKPIPVDTTAGLIPPTDPENWSRTVAKGRPDPFAVLALQPVVIPINNPLKKAPSTAAATIVNKSNSIPQSGGSTNESIPTKTNTKIATIKPEVAKPLPKINISTKLAKVSTTLNKSKIFGKGVKPKTSASEDESPGTGELRDFPLPISAIPRSGINRSLPKVIVAIPTPKSTLPTAMTKSGVRNPVQVAKSTPTTSSKKTSVVELPTKTQVAANPKPVLDKPLQAMAIEISGMIDVAGKTQVIVKLPDESFSRYVEVGDRIANGKVLVKRVDGQNSLSPTVVLEEVGVEVSRKIGEKSVPLKPESPPKP